MSQYVFSYPPHERPKLAPLFPGRDTLIAACLQGHMGRALADHPTQPQAAALQVGDFLFLGGKPAMKYPLVRALWQPGCTWIVTAEPAWLPILEAQAGCLEAALRWRVALPEAFDQDRLKGFAQGVALRFIDGPLYDQCLAQPWSRDFVSLFDDREDFLRRGLGVVAVEKGELVSGASSYAVYDGGLEIEVDTREDHRRRGLARACCARLILTCLERGLTPTWDAHSPASCALAESLGYRVIGPYPIWNWSC